MLRTHGGVLHTATIGDEYQIVLGQAHEVLFVLPQQFNTCGQLSLRVGVKFHVDHLGVVVELDAVGFQVLEHGQNHGLILVVAGKPQGLEVRQAADVVDEPLDIPFHLQSRMPVFKGEHGTPVKPEVGIQHFVVKVVGDTLIIELLIRREEKTHDLHSRFVRDSEFAISMGILPAVHSGPAEGIVGVLLVEPIVLVQNADPFCLNGGNGAEEIPHDLKVVIHFPTAAHDIAHILKLPSIAGAAGNGVLFKDVNVFALHLTVADQIAGGSQSRKAGTDDVSRFEIDAFGLLRAGECLVVTTGIIHEEHPFNIDF